MIKPSGRFFYGWVMLGIAVLLAVASMPGQSIVVALFNAGYSADLGISPTRLAAAYTIGTILASLPLSLVGKAADRFGLRVVVLCVAVAFACALAAQSLVGNIAALGLGFFFIRFLGQGSLSLLSGHTVAMWFERKLGRVHAVVGILGFAGGSAVVPFLAAYLIGVLGWRHALVALGGFVLVLVVPAVAILFRNRPEDIGQHLDGDRVEHATHDVLHGGSPPPGDPAFTVRQALRTRAFWLVVPCMLASGLIGTAFIFHMSVLLSGAGVEGDPTEMAGHVARANFAFPICSGLVAFPVGMLVDRFEARRLLPIGTVLMTLSTLVIMYGAGGGFGVGAGPGIGPAMVVPTMAVGMGLFGLGQGLINAVSNPTIARYFGRTHHGAIRGLITTAIVAGTGGGPLLVGLGHDLAGGSFTPVLLVFAIAGIPLTIGACFVTRPTPPAERDLVPGAEEPDPDKPDPAETVL